MAYGTATIRRVQKIFGPGNAYVVTAKRLVVGHVAIDLLPGPSELLVLADDSANANLVAADILARAEHGTGHERVWLVTDTSVPAPTLLEAYEGTVVVGASGSALTQRFPAPRTPVEHIYLVDPAGRLMMSFPADGNASRILKDMQRLLKYSQQG